MFQTTNRLFGLEQISLKNKPLGKTTSNYLDDFVFFWDFSEKKMIKTKILFFQKAQMEQILNKPILIHPGLNLGLPSND